MGFLKSHLLTPKYIINGTLLHYQRNQIIACIYGIKTQDSLILSTSQGANAMIETNFSFSRSLRDLT